MTLLHVVWPQMTSMIRSSGTRAWTNESIQSSFQQHGWTHVPLVRPGNSSLRAVWTINVPYSVFEKAKVIMDEIKGESFLWWRHHDVITNSNVLFSVTVIRVCGGTQLDSHFNILTTIVQTWFLTPLFVITNIFKGTPCWVPPEYNGNWSGTWPATSKSNWSHEKSGCYSYIVLIPLSISTFG